MVKKGEGRTRVRTGVCGIFPIRIKIHRAHRYTIQPIRITAKLIIKILYNFIHCASLPSSDRAGADTGRNE
jgi:hypothetical protein